MDNSVGCPRAAALLLAAVASLVRAEQPQAGYLARAEALHIEAWLPAPPAEDSMANAADVEAYLHSRALIGTSRAEEAHADDVVKPAEAVAARFAYVMGVTLDRKSTPQLLKMMELVRNDAEWLLLSVKKAVASGGRRRPFVDFPNLPSCPLVFEPLATTGSYPSGHALTGWLWASILAETVPEFADALLARGAEAAHHAAVSECSEPGARRRPAARQRYRRGSACTRTADSLPIWRRRRRKWRRC